jgi:hypothetical protein
MVLRFVFKGLILLIILGTRIVLQQAYMQSRPEQSEEQCPYATASTLAVGSAVSSLALNAAAKNARNGVFTLRTSSWRGA